MRNRAITSARESSKEDRRRRVLARHARLLKDGVESKEAIGILAGEEAKSTKTIYSILEGWR